MSEEQVGTQEQGSAQTTPTENANSVLDTSDQPVVSKEETVLDTAGEQEKAEKAANEARLREADPSTLTEEEIKSRDELLKSDEEAKAKALAEEKAKGVPEKYDLKAPEGVTLDEGRLKIATDAFKAQGFSNDQAQSMVDLFVNMTNEAKEEADKEFRTFKEQAADETMKALNSEGRTAKTELAYVARVKNYFSPETIEILSQSGMGNQKSFIMDLAKLGRLLSEEKNVDTGNPSAGGKSAAETLYPTMKK